MESLDRRLPPRGRTVVGEPGVRNRIADAMRRAAIAFVVMFLGLASASIGEAASIEAKVKSAYLYNLLRRTTWPENAFENDESPYRVTVLGQDNLEGLLETIADKKKVNKRAIELRRIQSIDEFRNGHVLYIPGYRTPEEQKAILAKTANRACLIVGDSPGFGTAGATANFVHRDDGTIGVELNVAEAAKHRLKFDHQLLSVAHVLGK